MFKINSIVIKRPSKVRVLSIAQLPGQPGPVSILYSGWEWDAIWMNCINAKIEFCVFL